MYSRICVCVCVCTGGEVECAGHEHMELVGVDSTYNIPLDKLFEMIFTDSTFYSDFTKARKTFGKNKNKNNLFV